MIIKMLTKRLNGIKLCAVFTAACFMISTLGANLYAIPMEKNSNQKYEDIFDKASSISNEYGKITSSKDANSDITVINIQDLHCHPQTQRNISKIIGQIADKYNLKSIYVEGGYGNIDTSWLNQIKDENIRKQVIERLIENGILTGSEYYKLTSNNKSVELKGIDEEKLHQDNIKRLSLIIENQDKYKEISKKINKEISFLEQRYVNIRNKRFNGNIEEYLSNKIDTKRFYRQLIKYVKDINANPENYNNITAIRLEDYPNISKFMTLRKVSKNINVREVTQQLQIVINELKNKLPYNTYTRLLKETENFSDSQKVVELITLLCDKEGIDLDYRYKSLSEFLKSNEINRELNTVKLVYEERQLITEIRKALSYNNEEYEITFISDFSRYFQDYLEYKLTDADWKYFESGYEQFRQLYSKYATVDRIKEIESDIAELNKYYEINDVRNEIFVNNLLHGEKPTVLNQSKLRQDEEILKQSKEVIIAVTGGFHSQALEEILQAKDVNTIVITPSIFEGIEKATKQYKGIIKEQSKEFQHQALAYKILSSEGNTLTQKAIMYGVLKSLLGNNTTKIKEILGDVDLRELDNLLQNLQENEQIQNKVSDITEILKIEAESLLNILPKKGGRTIFFPDIDKLLLGISKELIDMGIFLSDGVIFNIENSTLNGKDLKGIPAEVYSRMHPEMQQALLLADGNEVDSASSVQSSSDITDTKTKLSISDKLSKKAHIWEEAFFRFVPTILILSGLVTPLFGLIIQVAFVLLHLVRPVYNLTKAILKAKKEGNAFDKNDLVLKIKNILKRGINVSLGTLVLMTPYVVSILALLINPAFELIIAPALFIFSDLIVKWLTKKDSGGKVSINKKLIAPTLILSVISFLISASFPAISPLLNPIVITNAVRAGYLHYQYNKRVEGNEFFELISFFKSILDGFDPREKDSSLMEETQLQSLSAFNDVEISKFEDAMARRKKESLDKFRKEIESLRKNTKKELSKIKGKATQLEKQIKKAESEEQREELKKQLRFTNSEKAALENILNELNSGAVLKDANGNIKRVKVLSEEYLENVIDTINKYGFLFARLEVMADYLDKYSGEDKEELEQEFLDLVKNVLCDSLVNLYDDQATKFHVKMVMELGLPMYELIKFKPTISDKYRFIVMALMHDVGKNFIPVSVLNKKGFLEKPERQLIEEHVLFGSLVLDGSIMYRYSESAKEHHRANDYYYEQQADEEDQYIITPGIEAIMIADIVQAIFVKPDMLYEREYQFKYFPDDFAPVLFDFIEPVLNNIKEQSLTNEEINLIEEILSRIENIRSMDVKQKSGSVKKLVKDLTEINGKYANVLKYVNKNDKGIQILEVLDYIKDINDSNANRDFKKADEMIKDLIGFIRYGIPNTYVTGRLRHADETFKREMKEGDNEIRRELAFSEIMANIPLQKCFDRIKEKFNLDKKQFLNEFEKDPKSATDKFMEAIDFWEKVLNKNIPHSRIAIRAFLKFYFNKTEITVNADVKRRLSEQKQVIDSSEEQTEDNILLFNFLPLLQHFVNLRKATKTLSILDRDSTLDETNGPVFDTKGLIGKEILITRKTGDSYILCINSKSLSRRGRKWGSDLSPSAYGIKEIKRDRDGNIVGFVLEEGVRISNPEIDTDVIMKESPNKSFSLRQLNEMLKDSGVLRDKAKEEGLSGQELEDYISNFDLETELEKELEGLIGEERETKRKDFLGKYFADICLDDENLEDAIDDAIKNNKLMILHVFRDTKNLTLWELYKRYKTAYDLLQKDKLKNIPSLSGIIQLDQEVETDSTITFDFFLRELLKNHFGHGNSGLFEYPMACYISKDGSEMITYDSALDLDNGEKDPFNSEEFKEKNIIRNLLNKLMYEALISGDGKGRRMMDGSKLRNLKDGRVNINGFKFYRAQVSLKSKEEIESAKQYKKEHGKEHIQPAVTIGSAEDIRAMFEEASILRPLGLKLANYAHVWEEFIFRYLPAVAIFFGYMNPVFGIVIQGLFILAHPVVKSISSKIKGESSDISLFEQVKEDIKRLSLPTLVLMLPYAVSVLAFFINPALEIIISPALFMFSDLIVKWLTRKDSGGKVNIDKKLIIPTILSSILAVSITIAFPAISPFFNPILITNSVRAEYLHYQYNNLVIGSAKTIHAKNRITDIISETYSIKDLFNNNIEVNYGDSVKKFILNIKYNMLDEAEEMVQVYKQKTIEDFGNFCDCSVKTFGMDYELDKNCVLYDSENNKVDNPVIRFYPKDGNKIEIRNAKGELLNDGQYKFVKGDKELTVNIEKGVVKENIDKKDKNAFLDTANAKMIVWFDNLKLKDGYEFIEPVSELQLKNGENTEFRIRNKETNQEILFNLTVNNTRKIIVNSVKISADDSLKKQGISSFYVKLNRNDKGFVDTADVDISLLDGSSINVTVPKNEDIIYKSVGNYIFRFEPGIFIPKQIYLPEGDITNINEIGSFVDEFGNFSFDNSIDYVEIERGFKVEDFKDINFVLSRKDAPEVMLYFDSKDNILYKVEDLSTKVQIVNFSDYGIIKFSAKKGNITEFILEHGANIRIDVRQPLANELDTKSKILARQEQLAKGESVDLKGKTKEEMKPILMRAGLSEEQFNRIDFSKRHPLQDADEDIRQTLFDNNYQGKIKLEDNIDFSDKTKLKQILEQNPIIYSMFIEALIRTFETFNLQGKTNIKLDKNSTFDDLIKAISEVVDGKTVDKDYFETQFRGYFGEIYCTTTIVAGVFDGVILRLQMPDASNEPGIDLIDPVSGMKIQVKTPDKRDIVDGHLSENWREDDSFSEKFGLRMIPVFTTKSVKDNFYAGDSRVQSFGIEAATITGWLKYLLNYDENTGKMLEENKIKDRLSDNLTTIGIAFSKRSKLSNIKNKLENRQEGKRYLMLQKNKSILIAAIYVALNEANFSLNMEKDENGDYIFVKLHGDNTAGAIELMNFIEDWQNKTKWLNNISPRLATMIVKGASIVKHVVIDYKFIKASTIKETIEMLGKGPILNENGQIEVAIVDDIEFLQDSYVLINTGLKINGTSIYRIKDSNLLIYGAKGQQSIKIAKVLDGSDLLNKDIIEMLKANGEDIDKIQTQGIITKDGQGISVSEDIIEIGEMELEGKSPAERRQFIASSLEVKRAMGIMYGQKTIIDLKSVTDPEKLKATIYNGRARKVISIDQFENLNLTKEDIENLKKEGIEIYIDLTKEQIDKLSKGEISEEEIKEKIKEIYEKTKDMEIAGQVIRDKDGIRIKDYSVEEEIKIKEILKIEDIEREILTSQTPVMVGINILTEHFKQGNITAVQREFGALLGKIKMTFNIGDLNINDIENMGYNISFDRIPELKQEQIDELFEKVGNNMQIASNEKLIEVIGAETEFAIVLKSINNKEAEKRFREIIVERILAKKTLLERGNVFEGTELKDKNMEKILGKMLMRQIEKQYVDKVAKMNGVTNGNAASELIKDIERLKLLDKLGNEEETAEQADLVNDIIEIILYDGERIKKDQIQQQDDSGNLSKNYRTMLAAA